MSSEKYIGLDVHQATISVAVMDSQGCRRPAGRRSWLRNWHRISRTGESKLWPAFINGRSTKFSVSDGTAIDPQVRDVVARVAGLLIAGREYPLLGERTLECWVREARPGFLKLDLDSLTIICAATRRDEGHLRLLQAIANSHRLSAFGGGRGFGFVPIVKAGLFHEVFYYIEAPELPEVVFPDLVKDSLSYVFFWSPIQIDQQGLAIQQSTLTTWLPETIRINGSGLIRSFGVYSRLLQRISGRSLSLR
jgi:hypothetical protein